MTIDRLRYRAGDADEEAGMQDTRPLERSLIPRSARGNGRAIVRRAAALFGVLLTCTVVVALHYRPFLASTAQVNGVAAESHEVRLRPAVPDAACLPAAGDGPAQGGVPVTKALFARNPIVQTPLVVEASSDLQRVLVVESGLVVRARVYASTDCRRWEEVRRWPEDSLSMEGSYISPAFALSLKAAQRTHIVVRHQTLSGMTPLYSLRTVASAEARLALHMLAFGAMLSASLVTMLYMRSVWQITRERVIPLVLALAPLAGAYSGLQLGLHRPFLPGLGIEAATAIAHAGMAFVLLFVFFYTVRAARLDATWRCTRWLTFMLSIGVAAAPAVLMLEGKVGQDLLIVSVILCTPLLLIASVMTVGRHRGGAWHLAVAAVITLHGMGYVFAWFDLVPSDWVTWLSAGEPLLLGCFLASALLQRLQDRDRYWSARVRHGDVAQQREAQRHIASRLRAFSSVTHDVRQPLQSMGVLLTLLKSSRDPEDARRLVNLLSHAYDSLTELIDGFFDAARLNAGVMVPTRKAFELDELLGPLAVEYREAAAAKGIELRYVRASVRVVSDPQLLERIVRNLLSNAIASTSRGRVLLGCRRRAGDAIEIQVIDTGPGMPEAQRVLLETGQPLPGAGSGRVGLGLFIVVELGNLLGHKVAVRSSPERGTGVSVLLQRADGAASQAPQSAAASPEPALDVLCVGLSAPVRRWLELLLRAQGWRVRSPVSRQEARDLLLRGYVPDVCIGYEPEMPFVEELEALLRRPIPTVTLARGIGPSRVHQSLRADRLVLHKPADPRVLLQAVRAVGQPDARARPASGTGFLDDARRKVAALRALTLQRAR